MIDSAASPSDPRAAVASATLDTVTTAASPAPAATEPRTTYGSLWRGVPRELGFLILTMPIAIVGLSVLQTLFWTGVGTLVIYIGIFILVATFYTARAFGTVEVVRLRWAGRREIQRPRWEPADRPASFWRSLFGPFVNGHYWLYLLHGLLINPIVSIVSWTLTIVWVSVALGGLTGWIWEPFVPQGDRDFFLSSTIVDFVFQTRSTFDPLVGDRVLYVIAGAAFAATLPFLTRGLTLLHDVIARGMLGAWQSEALKREVADLSASRGAAVAAEDSSLRRLERDLHDGPQQRLIRLQMDIAAAERKLADDPEAAATLLAEARQQAGDTLEELRALSRGFAPPLLQDRGLQAAAESLAARSPIPVTVESSLAPGERFAPETERNAYYVLAELAANLAKHSGATQARLFLDRTSGATGPLLEVWLTDNGRGGAAEVPGHGLSGLDERVRGLRGELVVESPVGGPTRVGARFPLG
ncbi:sensor domain-containing protein [Leifsonia sp. F6_8S_P_1B]|uniref:histidine kinase n=1 Tax=Leifsonia williamsii TaxID=3035919 RepID=A0ABT8KCD4_9MICO|nr:sensor domain-containing protein [Leifsonia williamsii]MDN4615120.1 sensor domain-containing protein [Leifsonia williamsii]